MCSVALVVLCIVIGLPSLVWRWDTGHEGAHGTLSAAFVTIAVVADALDNIVLAMGSVVVRTSVSGEALVLALGYCRRVSRAVTLPLLIPHLTCLSASLMFANDVKWVIWYLALVPCGALAIFGVVVNTADSLVIVKRHGLVYGVGHRSERINALVELVLACAGVLSGVWCIAAQGNYGLCLFSLMWLVAQLVQILPLQRIAAVPFAVAALSTL